jgi:hypothetical protein
MQVYQRPRLWTYSLSFQPPRCACINHISITHHWSQSRWSSVPHRLLQLYACMYGMRNTSDRSVSMERISCRGVTIASVCFFLLLKSCWSTPISFYGIKLSALFTYQKHERLWRWTRIPSRPLYVWREERVPTRSSFTLVVYCADGMAKLLRPASPPQSSAMQSSTCLQAQPPTLVDVLALHSAPDVHQPHLKHSPLVPIATQRSPSAAAVCMERRTGADTQQSHFSRLLCRRHGQALTPCQPISIICDAIQYMSASSTPYTCGRTRSPFSPPMCMY